MSIRLMISLRTRAAASVIDSSMCRSSCMSSAWYNNRVTPRTTMDADQGLIERTVSIAGLQVEKFLQHCGAKPTSTQWDTFVLSANEQERLGWSRSSLYRKMKT